jgi:hypothetical protein
VSRPCYDPSAAARSSTRPDTSPMS